MSNIDQRLAGGVAVLLLAAAATGIAVSAGADGSRSGPARCEIREAVQGDTIALQALVHADRSIKGSYSFSVTGGGGSGSNDIQQGGDFEAQPGPPASLGQVSVGARGGAYDARLTVTFDGTSISCARQIAGAI
jgi:hypothetical protein